MFCSQVQLNLTYWGVSFVTTEGLCTPATNHNSPLFICMEPTSLFQALEQPKNGRQETQLVFKTNLKKYMEGLTCCWCLHQQETWLSDPKDSLSLHKFTCSLQKRDKAVQQQWLSARLLHHCMMPGENLWDTPSPVRQLGAFLGMASAQEHSMTVFSTCQTLLPVCTSIYLQPVHTHTLCSGIPWF